MMIDGSVLSVVGFLLSLVAVGLVGLYLTNKDTGEERDCEKEMMFGLGGMMLIITGVVGIIIIGLAMVMGWGNFK